MRSMLKNKPPFGLSQMDRVRAARAIVDSCRGESAKNVELHAFMAIFHPEVPEQKVKRMVRDRRR